MTLVPESSPEVASGSRTVRGDDAGRKGYEMKRSPILGVRMKGREENKHVERSTKEDTL